jgi:hypothetical protein
MRIWSITLIFSLALFGISCGETQPASPVETFKTYTKAIKKKDLTTMKLLLSRETIKMHDQEAKAQGVTVDDIVKRETLVSEGQTTVEYRNEKIDGDKATLEYKTSYGTWETMPFVREDGVWKIDKKGFADQMLKDMDESNRKLDELINSATPIGAPPANADPLPVPQGNSPLGGAPAAPATPLR